MAALHFLPPTGDSRSGRRSFDSKHLPSPARRGSRSRTASPPASLCDSKGSECPCGIHRAEAASALRSRKTERAAKEKPTPISQFFLAPAAPWHPNSPPRPGGAPHPAPSARTSATQTAQKTALCAPWEHSGGFGIRKSASNSGHSPLRGLGGCSMHCSMHYSMHCSTHCRPSLFAAHRR